MNKIAEMIMNGEINVEDLASVDDLIKRAKLVKQGVEACKKTITFPLGETSVKCYSYVDHAGEYEAWGSCDVDGTFTCSTTWGGTHVIGKCNLTSFKEVFMAFENDEFAHNLERFLTAQIEKAE